MTTVTELKEFLNNFSPDTVVEVVTAYHRGGENYVEFQDLYLGEYVGNYSYHPRGLLRLGDCK
jgi:hypothetical protein